MSVKAVMQVHTPAWHSVDNRAQTEPITGPTRRSSGCCPQARWRQRAQKKLAGCLEGGTAGGEGVRSSPIRRTLWWRPPAGPGDSQRPAVCYMRARRLLTPAFQCVIKYSSVFRKRASLSSQSDHILMSVLQASKNTFIQALIQI